MEKEKIYINTIVDAQCNKIAFQIDCNLIYWLYIFIYSSLVAVCYIYTLNSHKTLTANVKSREDVSSFILI